MLGSCVSRSDPVIIPDLQVSIIAPEGIADGQYAEWQCDWESGVAPYKVYWDFGRATGGNLLKLHIAENTLTVSYRMQSAGDDVIEYTATVTVTDAKGRQGQSSVTYSFIAYEEFVLTASQATDGELEVTINGGVGPYTVRVSEPTGLRAEQTEVVTLDGHATFNYTAIDPVYGGGGLCFIRAEDSLGQTKQTDEYILYKGMQLNDDTLYAIPLKHVVKVDEPVTIMVATGATAHSFQYMLGVGVVLDDDGFLRETSLNYGAIGGEKTDADGVWSSITVNGGFAMGPDTLLIPGQDPEGTLPPGTNRWGLSVSPLQIGVDPTKMDAPSVKGALINFQVTYSTPGKKYVGFQQVNGVNRTYYSNATDLTDRFWSVLMADETGTLHPSVVGQVDNTIMVLE